MALKGPCPRPTRRRGLLLVKFGADLKNKNRNKHSNQTACNCAFIVLSINKTNHVDEQKDDKRKQEFVEYSFHSFCYFLFVDNNTSTWAFVNKLKS